VVTVALVAVPGPHRGPARRRNQHGESSHRGKLRPGGRPRPGRRL